MPSPIRPEDPDSGPPAVCFNVAPGGTPNTVTCKKPPSTNWFLFVHIDTEADDWEDACRSQEFGHAFVEFFEDNQTRYTYGFYPAKDLPNETRRAVPGAVHHPDTTHMDSVDETVVYWLTQAQYQAALQRAQDICRTPPMYGQSYTCASFVEEIVLVAGQTLPSAKSTPTTIFYQAVPAIDNPNTLVENVAAARRVLPRRTPFWNNECVNEIEAAFQRCIASSTDGGMVCVARRGASLQSCAPSPSTPAPPPSN